MSTTKFEHVIGCDGLHRLRLTAANGEIIDNSYEGFSDGVNAWLNLRLKLAAYLELGGMANALSHATATSLVEAMIYRPITKGLVPTVDERDSEPVPAEPAADPLRHERVFGKPADPFEPQTHGPVEPQLR